MSATPRLNPLPLELSKMEAIEHIFTAGFIITIITQNPRSKNIAKRAIIMAQ